ncbi:MAG: prephenate dehydratase [Helicobacter sp.]|nr:prephenate dehydratase [Helicobacter sp.]
MKLEDIRAQIDELDCKLQALLNERANLALHVARIKAKTNEPLYRPEREAQILRNVLSRNSFGAMDDDKIIAIFRQIISACLALESMQKVAFLGPLGTFTELAVRKHFGDSAQILPRSDIDLVFHAVETREANYGVVPVENSSEGAVNHTLDCFKTSDLSIIGEIELNISHNLLAAQDTELLDIKIIYAHEQALAQCRKYLDANFKNAQKIAVSSNALAAQKVTKNVAVIASEAAAKLYDLKILAQNIQDRQSNITRFLIIGKNSIGKSGADKTSLLIHAKDEVGALLSILTPLAKYNLSMTSIQTRPSVDKWSYIFFIDLLGHVQDRSVQLAINEIAANVIQLKILGSYPVAIG